MKGEWRRSEVVSQCAKRTNAMSMTSRPRNDCSGILRRCASYVAVSKQLYVSFFSFFGRQNVGGFQHDLNVL